MSDPIAETIIARVTTVLRAIDGGVYTETVRSKPIVGTYNYDLTDAPTDRVKRGGLGEHDVDGAQIYIWVDFSQPPMERTLCDDTATVTLSLLCYAVTEADTGDERQKAGLRLAHDIRMAMSIDYAGVPIPPNSLGAMNIYKLTMTTQEFQGQMGSVGWTDPGVSMQMAIEYNLPGGAGL